MQLDLHEAWKVKTHILEDFFVWPICRVGQDQIRTLQFRMSLPRIDKRIWSIVFRWAKDHCWSAPRLLKVLRSPQDDVGPAKPSAVHLQKSGHAWVPLHAHLCPDRTLGQTGTYRPVISGRLW